MADLPTTDPAGPPTAVGDSAGIRLEMRAGLGQLDYAATAVAAVCRRTKRTVDATVRVAEGEVPPAFRAGNLVVEFTRDEGADCGAGRWPLGVHQLVLAGPDELFDRFAGGEVGAGRILVGRTGASEAGRADLEWGDTQPRFLDWSGGRMPWEDAGVCGFQLWVRELTCWEDLKQELRIREQDRGRMPAFVIHRAGTGVRREELQEELLDAGFALEPVIGMDPDYPFGVRVSVALLLDFFGWPAGRADMARALSHRWAWLDFLTRTDEAHALFCEDEAAWEGEANALRAACGRLGEGPWMLEPGGGGMAAHGSGVHDRCYCLSRAAAAMLLDLDLTGSGPFASGVDPLSGLQRLALENGKVVALSDCSRNEPDCGGAGEYSGPRILIAICSCHGNAGRRQAVRDSWFPRAVPGMGACFVVGDGDAGDIGPDTIRVAAPDNRDGMAFKIREFFRIALERFDFEWLFLCEDDTYVAVDRVAGLADSRADLVAGASVLQGDGGAGCLLARALIVALAEIDPWVVPAGAGVAAIVEAAIAAGAVAKGSPRLCPKVSAASVWENDHVTCHPVTERMMEAIHRTRTTAPLCLLEAGHPYWRDHVVLHPGGLFRRKSKSDMGRWIWNGDARLLTLAWFSYHPETFVVGGDGRGRLLPGGGEEDFPAEPRGGRGKIVFAHALGRTGNQLFQYAYGLHLSRKFGCRLRGNLHLLAGMAGIPGEMTGGRPPERTASLHDVDDGSAARCLAGPDIEGIELKGYFQSYGHFEGIADELARILGEVPKRDAIGVHVRRGDYLTVGYYLRLALPYYATAIRLIMGRYPGPFREIVVFSDDPAWCVENLLPGLSEILPASIFEGGPVDALKAMKSMRGMVIPNSSFSWWGAWLAQCPTVFPDQWLSGLPPGLGCTRPDWISCPTGRAPVRPAASTAAGAPLPRVLFLIKSSPGNADRRAAQEDRWLRALPDGSEYYFCIGGHRESAPRVDGHLLLLPGEDTYERLPAKMKRIVEWAAGEERCRRFDFMVTLDDDVAVDAARLFAFLEERPDHFGNRWQGYASHISGMFAGYSAKAFRILARMIHTLPDTGPDDLLVGRIAHREFVGLRVLTDRERFVPNGGRITGATIAVEIDPFSPAAMRDFRFPPFGGRKRLSFCLFGDNPVYTQGALANLRLARKYYPGWEAVFYTKAVPDAVVSDLRARGATVVECDHANMMLARFLPFCEEGIILSRDCDSRVGPREVRAVDEWLSSTKPHHVIRDHPEHLAGWANVLGGLWGSREPFGDRIRRSLESALEDPRYGGWGGDQRWLNEHVWNPARFLVHQYDRVGWMKNSWDQTDFCGMRRPVGDGAPAGGEVLLVEGFFNRLNGLVNGLLIHGPEFKARWALNRHLPHRFGDLFDPIAGIEVSDEPDLRLWSPNTDPAKGPLHYWFVSRHCGASPDEVERAYRHLLAKLKVAARDPGAPLGLYFRGLHHSSRVGAGDFARWCVGQARARGASRCFALADSGRDEIGSILAESGIEVIWGRSAEMARDLDRGGLEDLRDFVGDALALAACDAVLVSFAETTVADPARAFGREVVSFSGSRAWSECWFQHCGRRRPPGSASPAANAEPGAADAGMPRILIAEVRLSGAPHAEWKEGYELCHAFRSLGCTCDVAGPGGTIPETRIPEIAGDYDLVLITENYPQASGWKWWDWKSIRTPKMFWAIDTHLVDYRPWIRSAGIGTVAFNNPDDMERYGLASSFFMPYAASRRRFSAGPARNPVRDLGFIGAGTPERRRVCGKFGIEMIAAFGTDYAREMGATRICFNQAISYDINHKFFEIPASGSFMLTNFNGHFFRAMEFREDVARMFYHSEDHLAAKIRYYLKHEDERAAVAKSVRDYLLANHSWEDRARLILVQHGLFREPRPAPYGPAAAEPLRTPPAADRSGSGPTVSDGPETLRIDLRTIPVCLIGGDGGVPRERQHRYASDVRFQPVIFPHTEAVPPAPGGHTLGCSAAHREAAGRALEQHPEKPVLLLENDAVTTGWFGPVLDDVPADADIVWLGRSVEVHKGRATPEHARRSEGRFNPLTGICQGAHSILLVTDRGKRAWQACAAQAARKERGGFADLVGSAKGIALCRQYVIDRPLFYQPDYCTTELPLPVLAAGADAAGGPSRKGLPATGPTPLVFAGRLVIAEHLHQRNLTVVDIGAGAGEFCDELGCFFQVRRTVLVEASPDLFGRLIPEPGRILVNGMSGRLAAATGGISPEDATRRENGTSPPAHPNGHPTAEARDFAGILALCGPHGEIDILKIDLRDTGYGTLLDAAETDLARVRQISAALHGPDDANHRSLVTRVGDRMRALGFAAIKRMVSRPGSPVHWDAVFFRDLPAMDEAVPAASHLRVPEDLVGTWDQFNDGIFCSQKTFHPWGGVCCGDSWVTEESGTIRFGSHRVRPTSDGALAGFTEDGVALYYLRANGMVMPEPDRSDPLDVLAGLMERRTETDLTRYGPDRDGGYCVPAGVAYDLVVTVGVGYDIGFETAYSAAHPGSRFELFDHTVAGLPVPLPNSKFHRTGVGYGDCLHPLPDLLREALRTPARKVLLKMDCEGAEWDCGLERVDFSQIDTLVLEIHDMLRPVNRIRTARVLAALSDHFVLVHAAPNNCTPQGTVGDRTLTSCVELTLVNKRHPPPPRCGSLPPMVPNDPARPPGKLHFPDRRDRIPTVISGFFDLGACREAAGRRWDAAFDRSVIPRFAKLENPLVFFAETEADLELIDRIRAETRHSVKAVPIARAGLKSFGSSGSPLATAPFPDANARAAEYLSVQHAKYELVGRAAAGGLIETTHCCWMDCGRILDVLVRKVGHPCQLQHRPEYGRGIHYTRAGTFAPLPLEAIRTANGEAGACWLSGNFFYGRADEMEGWCDSYLAHALRYQAIGYAFTDQETLYAMMVEGLADTVTAHPFRDKWFGLCADMLRTVRPRTAWSGTPPPGSAAGRPAASLSLSPAPQ